MADHSKCVDGQRNEHCPSGLHTRVPILGLGAMYERKRRERQAQKDNAR